MNLKFSNISNGEATMLIYKHIGYDSDEGYGVDGNSFANELNWLNENFSKEISVIKVRINSIGGSVSEGLSICSAILNSKIPVDTYIDGMAYSMAGVAAVCGRKKYMADFATFMMHNVNGGDNEQVIDLLTNSLAIIFERNTALTIDKCREMMDKETWMSAEQCKSMGIIDEVVTTAKDNKERMNQVKNLFSFYNKQINHKQPIKMNRLTNLLKLSNEASEEAIATAVETLHDSLSTAESLSNTLKAENELLKARIAEYEAAEAAKEEAAKEEVLTNAVKEGKLNADLKAEWKNKPLKSTELKNLFDSIKPGHVTVIPTAKQVDENDPRNKWNYRQWEQNDPKGLLEIKNTDTTRFEALVKTIGAK